MENFNAFINELQTLKINVNEYRYEVGDYNQYSNYEYELKRLQQAALNDLTILSKEQLENYLRRLSQPQKRFVKIWEFYQRTYALFRENKFEFSAFNQELKDLFIIENFNAVLVTEQFFFDLHDAIVLKEGYLLEFEAQLREVFGLNVDAKNNAEKHADEINTKAEIKYVVKYHVLAYLFDCHIEGIIPCDVNEKTKLEDIGKKRVPGKSGNTFYKEYGKYYDIDLNNENSIAEIFGENWRIAVLSLSKNPDLVEKYLKSKQL